MARARKRRSQTRKRRTGERGPGLDPPGPAARNFLVVGHRAPTSPRFKLEDLPGSAGRLDVVCRCINAALFLSNGLRRDSQVWAVLQGPPGPPVTVRFDGARARYLNPDERSTAALVRHGLIKLEEAEAAAEARESAGVPVGEPAKGPAGESAGVPIGEPAKGPAGESAGELPDELERTPGVYVSRGGLKEALDRLAAAKARMVLLQEGAAPAAWVVERLAAERAAPEQGTSPPWAFVLGDDKDLAEEELALVSERAAVTAGLGSTSLLSSHCIVLVQALLDGLEGGSAGEDGSANGGNADKGRTGEGTTDEGGSGEG